MASDVALQPPAEFGVNPLGSDALTAVRLLGNPPVPLWRGGLPVAALDSFDEN